MVTRHKNKTFASLLALLTGGLGFHRFYLYGWKDTWGWLHVASLPLSLLIMFSARDLPLIFSGMPFLVSVLAGFIETFVIGLSPDDKWDALHNRDSGRVSDSGWPIPIVMVLTLAIGATALIALLARTFDLLYTGGAYG
ncbi:MAG: NINE protein [Pseudomonadota bacterium]